MTAPSQHRDWCDPAQHDADGSCRSAPITVRDRSPFALVVTVQLYQAADAEHAYLELSYVTSAGQVGGLAVHAESAAQLGYVMRHLALQAVTS